MLQKNELGFWEVFFERRTEELVGSVPDLVRSALHEPLYLHGWHREKDPVQIVFPFAERDPGYEPLVVWASPFPIDVLDVSEPAVASGVFLPKRKDNFFVGHLFS